MPQSAIAPLILFMALILAAALHGLAASGHFPRQHRAAALTAGLGPVVLFGSMAVVIVCVIAAVAGAARSIPWYAAVIGGGLSVLVAPLVLQMFSDRFVDGRAALLVFAGAAAVFALSIWHAAGALH